MPAVGTPAVGEREAVHADVELAPDDEEHEHHEEFVSHFEQEERCPSIGAKPVPVLLHEADDLTVGQRHQVEFTTLKAVDFLEVSILDHLPDLNLGGSSWLPVDVATVVAEVRVDVPVEDVTPFGDELGAISRIQDEFFTSRDQLEAADDLLGQFGEEPLEKFPDFGRHMVAVFENHLGGLSVETESFESFFHTLTDEFFHFFHVFCRRTHCLFFFQGDCHNVTFLVYLKCCSGDYYNFTSAHSAP